MPSSPLGSTDDRTASGLACHHRLWVAHTVERRQAWHAIIAFGKHTRSYDVGRGMPSSPLGRTHGRTTSGMACHHSPWTANTVERRHAWHANIAFGQHRRSDGVGRGMPSSPWGSTHSRTTSGVAFHHSPWMANNVERCRAWLDITALGLHARSDNVRRGMTSPPWDSTHDRQRRAWHDITALGQHTRSATSSVA